MAMPRAPATPLRGPFTVADYYRMAESGLLGPAERVELLDGMVVSMTPIGRRHAACVNRLNALLAPLATRASIAVQNPVRLDERSEPQPDVAILRRRADGYAGGHPGPADVLLVIEVADTSAATDREIKLPLYAGRGVRETWIVDLQADVIEVYAEPSGDEYRVVRTVRRGETMAPGAIAELVLAATDILG